MEPKHNEATTNRPEGSRVIDDSFVKIALPDFIRQIKEEHAWHNSDRNAITVFKTERVTIVLSAMHEGAQMIKQSTGDLMQVHVLEGELHMETQNGSIKLTGGEMALLHKGYSYDIEAKAASVFLLSLYNETNSGI